MIDHSIVSCLQVTTYTRLYTLVAVSDHSLDQFLVYLSIFVDQFLAQSRSVFSRKKPLKGENREQRDDSVQATTEVCETLLHQLLLRLNLSITHVEEEFVGKRKIWTEAKHQCKKAKSLSYCLNQNTNVIKQKKTQSQY